MNRKQNHETDQGADGPMIGIVIPLFRHSGLVSEAIASVLNQSLESGFVVGIVNDGCPFEESEMVCLGLGSKTERVPIHVIRRVNGGLSAARNTGINFLIQKYPSLDAIYFLDADNRLENYALANMAEALQSYPDADWFYPDIEMFGLEHTAQYQGEYSPLIHAGTNICEAGSLVRLRVFEAGVRFDERMRQGFEDWDFWLSACVEGFVGRHLPHMGLSYRKRPESMLADSHRDEEEIKSYIRRKHASLYQLKNLLALENQNHPRFAVFLDNGKVIIGLDPKYPIEVVSVSEFTRRFWRWMLRPAVHSTMPFLVFMKEITYQLLCERKLLIWVLWDLETRLEEVALSGLKISNRITPGLEIQPATISNTKSIDDVLMLKVDLLRSICEDQSPNWTIGLIAGDPDFAVSSRQLYVDDTRADLLERGSLEARMYQSIIEIYHSNFRPVNFSEASLHASGIPPRHLAYKNVRAAVNGVPVLPLIGDGRRHIAFVLPHADFGGVEKVAYNIARELRTAGFVPHLVLFQTGEIHLPVSYREVFESYLWATSKDLLRWDGADYHGTRLSWWSTLGDKTKAIGLLAPFDVVINCQSADAHGVIGELKRRGVLTIAHAHVVEQTRAGRPGGSATIARAFEHSYSAVWVASHQLKSWFVANAVPQEKIFVVENAASYVLPEGEIEEIRKERNTRPAGRQLRILFAGRFDVQKGLDRLLSLIHEAKKGGLPIDWRILGKSIVEADESTFELGRLIPIEKPAYLESELTEIYRWADVILLPSRFEGLPLTILEAMRCGVVVVAADAGAISEAIMSGKDGFIVPQINCVVDMYKIISDFSAFPEKLRPIALEAMHSGASRTWALNLKDAVRCIEKIHPKAEALKNA